MQHVMTQEELDQRYASKHDHEKLQVQVEAKMEVVEAKKGEILAAVNVMDSKIVASVNALDAKITGAVNALDAKIIGSVNALNAKVDAQAKATHNLEAWLRMLFVVVLGILIKMVMT